MLENENCELAQDKMKELVITDGEIEMKILLEMNKSLTEEKYKLVEEKHKMMEDRQRLVSEVSNLEAEVKHFRTENSEFRKRMITAEIKVTLLTNGDLLEEKFGDLKWSELTPEFQEELLEKLEMCGRPLNFDEILPINSKALMRLIKAGEKDETLLQNIIEDYYEEKKQPNGKVVWEDVDDSLRVYLTSKLRESSQLKSLELEQVPLSSNTLVHLMQDKSENNPDYLGKIVAGYVDEVVNDSSVDVEDLFMMAILKYINEEVLGCVDIHLSNPEVLDLVKLGVLRNSECEFEAPYEFVHDCVRHCIIGTIMRNLMKHVKVSRMNVVQLFYGGYTEPLGLYFADYMSEIEPSYLKKFDFVEIWDNTLASLFMILCVLRLPSLEPVVAVLKHCNIDVVDIALSRKLPPSEYLTLTLLHAAAIKGDMERVRCLLYEFGFSTELTDPLFLNLVLACVENTKECSGEQIQKRKEIIKELFELNKDLSNCYPPNESLKVDNDLIKFMIGLGAVSWLPLLEN